MRLACGCPDTFPDWHGKDVDLSLHPAHSLPITTFFHMPLAYAARLERQRAEIEQLELKEPWPGFILTQTNFMAGRIISLLNSAQSPSRHVLCLPASFHISSLLHAGGISTLRNSVRELQSTLFDAGRMPKELFLAHLTCPRCAAARGGEKILLLRRWTDSSRLKHRQRPTD